MSIGAKGIMTPVPFLADDVSFLAQPESYGLSLIWKDENILSFVEDTYVAVFKTCIPMPNGPVEDPNHMLFYAVNHARELDEENAKLRRLLKEMTMRLKSYDSYPDDIQKYKARIIQ